MLPLTQVGMDQSPEHCFSEVLPARVDYEVSTASGRRDTMNTQ